jgi:hypothetical protein
MVSTVIIFAFKYICTHFLHHIRLLPLFPITSPLPLEQITPIHLGRNYFALLFSVYVRGKTENVKKKSMTFLLV